MKIDEKVKDAVRTIGNHCKQYDNDCNDDKGERCPFSGSFGGHKHCSFQYSAPIYWREDVLKERGQKRRE